MADRAQLEAALLAAHKAGNEADARALAKALAQMRGNNGDVTMPPGDKTAAMQQESPKTGIRRAHTSAELGEVTAAPSPGVITRIRESLSPLIGNTDRQQAVQDSRNAFVGAEGRQPTIYERGVVPAVATALRQPAATSVRVGGGVLGSTGGPSGATINAAAESLGQIIGGENTDNGRIAQSAILGYVPLGSNAGMVQKIVNAAKMAAGGYAGEQARSLIDEGKLSQDAGKAAAISGGASLAASAISKILAKIGGRSSPEDMAEMAAKRFSNAETDASIKKLTDQGAVVNPASQNPSLVNRALGATAGLENIKNEMARINTPVLDRVARAEAKLRPDEIINEDNLAVARNRIRGPLNELRGLGLEAEVDAWQAANQTRQDLLEMRTNGDIAPAQFRQQLAGVQAAMRSTEQTIDAAAARAGKPELVGILPEIQEAQAKNYDVRRMTPSGTGHINPNMASAIAQQRVEHPETLTGGLRDIANFNNAAYGPSRSVNKIAPHGGALGPGVGLAVAGQGGAPAAISAGAMSLRGPIARKLLSPEYQAGKGILGRLSGGARPNYTPGTTSDPELEALMTRIAAILAATQAESK